MRKLLLFLVVATSGLATMGSLPARADDGANGTNNATVTQTQAQTVAVAPDVPDAPRPAQWAQPVRGTSIPNLYRITPMLYRSAQISARDVPALHKLGIKKVISLRAFHSDEAILQGSGIAIERIPLHTWHIEDEDIVTALRALHDANRDGPILLHCQHGADRTGLVSALYRVAYQGWSRKAALDELLHGGYGFNSIWVNIPRYLQRADIARLREAASLPPTAK